MLRIGTLTFGDLAHPQRTPVNRSRSRRVRVTGPYDTQRGVYDFGPAPGFLHVFQTEGNVGHLTSTERAQLEALEESGAAFTVQTDLLGADGVLQTFNASFDTEQKPVYRPATPSGEYWQFQIALYLEPQGG